MNLTKHEISEIQKAIEVQIKELSSLQHDETWAQKENSGPIQRLKSLTSAKSKLAYELGKSPDFSNYHVLVVDDIPSVRDYIIELLEENGFRHVDEANDGANAIAKIKNKSKDMPYGKVVPYDLVLCDMNMPMISGVDLLKLVRENRNFSTIAFIMITGVMDKINLLKCAKLGVSD